MHCVTYYSERILTTETALNMTSEIARRNLVLAKRRADVQNYKFDEQSGLRYRHRGVLWFDPGDHSVFAEKRRKEEQEEKKRELFVAGREMFTSPHYGCQPPAVRPRNIAGGRFGICLSSASFFRPGERHAFSSANLRLRLASLHLRPTCAIHL